MFIFLFFLFCFFSIRIFRFPCPCQSILIKDCKNFSIQHLKNQLYNIQHITLQYTLYQNFYLFIFFTFHLNIISLLFLFFFLFIFFHPFSLLVSLSLSPSLSLSLSQPNNPTHRQPPATTIPTTTTPIIDPRRST